MTYKDFNIKKNNDKINYIYYNKLLKNPFP